MVPSNAVLYINITFKVAAVSIPEHSEAYIPDEMSCNTCKQQTESKKSINKHDECTLTSSVYLGRSVDQHLDGIV